jgi:hypothetical protein
LYKVHPLKESGKGSLKKVGTLLSSIFKNLGIEDKIRLNSMQEEWHRLFNEPLSKHTYPVDIKDGELTINVDSPAWLGQLKFFKQDIIKKLQAYDVTSVKFKHGRVYSRGFKDSRGQVLKGAEPSNPRPLNPSDIEWINQTVSDIDDADLKEGIKKAIEKSVSTK